MRLAVMSDLHLEFDARIADAADEAKKLDFYLAPPPPDADVLVRAGDIDMGSLGLRSKLSHPMRSVELGQCEA